jgi:hypothetical protein
LLWIEQILYNPGLAFQKLSILVLYRRLTPSQAYRYTVNALIVLVLGLCVALPLAITFRCIPLSLNWNIAIPGATLPGHCVNRVNLAFAAAGLQIGFDISILLLPIPMVWSK